MLETSLPSRQTLQKVKRYCPECPPNRLNSIEKLFISKMKTCPRKTVHLSLTSNVYALLHNLPPRCEPPLPSCPTGVPRPLLEAPPTYDSGHLWSCPCRCIDSLPLAEKAAIHLGFPQMAKNLPAVQKTWVQSLGRQDPLEKGMATHVSILAWRIPWTEHIDSNPPGSPEPGILQARRLEWAAISFSSHGKS